VSTYAQCDLFVFVWLGCWAIRAARSILRGRRQSVDFLILTHFVLSGVPALLNLLIGHPLFFTFTEFEIEDLTTEMLYSAFVAVCPVIWWYWGRSPEPTVTIEPSSSSLGNRDGFFRRIRFVLYAIACSPLVVLLGAPDPAFYSSYGAIVRLPTTEAILGYHKWIAVSTLFSVLAIVCIWWSSRYLAFAVVKWSPMLLLALWLSGKRFVVLLAVALLIVMLWERRVLTGWKLAAAAFAGIVGFACFSYSYQSGIRSTDLLSAAKQYDDFRIDYGRDHGIKFAIYCELHPEHPAILEYRGQSLLFILTMPVPRELWTDKPWPYGVYATAAGQGLPPTDLGWGITASWLEEAIANFGLLGLLAGPAALALLCRIGDGLGCTLTRLLTILLGCLLLAMSSAFPIVKIAWLLSVVQANRRNKQRKAKRSKDEVKSRCDASRLTTRECFET
jgi:hypothetical protein